VADGCLPLNMADEQAEAFTLGMEWHRMAHCGTCMIARHQDLPGKMLSQVFWSNQRKCRSATLGVSGCTLDQQAGTEQNMSTEVRDPPE
jgi:hypothetical protein